MKAILSTILLVAFAIQGTIAQNQIDPKKTEDWSRKPEIVSPGKKAQAPSDAIILFDKGSLDAWESTGKDASAKCVITSHSIHYTKLYEPKSIWWYSDVKHVGFRVVCEVPDSSYNFV